MEIPYQVKKNLLILTVFLERGNEVDLETVDRLLDGQQKTTSRETAVAVQIDAINKTNACTKPTSHQKD